MVRGSNSIVINTTVELKQLIDTCKVTEGQGLLHNSFYIARSFLIAHKQDFISMNMQLRGISEHKATELYEKELEKWSRTQNQLRDEAIKKKEAEEQKVLDKAEQIKRRKTQKVIEKLLNERSFWQSKDTNMAKKHVEEIDQQLKALGFEET